MQDTPLWLRPAEFTGGRSERNEKIYFGQVSALPDGPHMDGGADACYN